MKKVQVPLTEQQVRLYHALAQEIAQAYQTKENILRTLNISDQQFDEIAQSPTFQKILRQAVAEWGTANNTSKRVKLKSQWAVEEALPYMFEAMTDMNEPLSARVEAFKSVAKIGQLDFHEANPTADRSFKIEINIGMGQPPITIDSGAIPIIDIEPEPQAIPSRSTPINSPYDADHEPNYSPGRFVPADPPTFGGS